MPYETYRIRPGRKRIYQGRHEVLIGDNWTHVGKSTWTDWKTGGGVYADPPESRAVVAHYLAGKEPSASVKPHIDITNPRFSEPEKKNKLGLYAAGIAVITLVYFFFLRRK